MTGWNVSKLAASRPDPEICQQAASIQPDGLATPLVALVPGVIYAKLLTGHDLPPVERVMGEREFTGIVEIIRPHCYRVYVNGRCRHETTSEQVAAGELVEYIERPGIAERLALWLLAWHDARTTVRLAQALRDAREQPV